MIWIIQVAPSQHNIRRVQWDGYIPWKMHMVLLCFVCCGYIISFHWMYMIYLPISFSVTSLTLGQSYDCPSASEVTLKDVGKINKYQTTRKHNKTDNKKIILGMCSKFLRKKTPHWKHQCDKKLLCTGCDPFLLDNKLFSFESWETCQMNHTAL